MNHAYRVLLSIVLVAAFLWIPGDQPTVMAQQQADTASAETAYLAIPAASFIPSAPLMIYENHGRYIKYKGSEETGVFVAAVHLPHEATLISVKGCFYDDSTTLTGNLSFSRATGGMFSSLAGVDSEGSSGFQELIDYPPYAMVADNTDTQYFVKMSLPISTGAGSNVWGCGAVVEFLPPAEDEGVLSLPAASFRPFEDGYTFSNEGGLLYHYQKPGGSLDNGIYLAPVNLPEGAVLSEISVHIHDQDGVNRPITIRLERSNRAGENYEMTNLSCEGSSLCSKSLASPISNTYYDYWILLELPVRDPGLYVFGVSIDYALDSYVTPDAVSLSNTAFTSYYSNDDYENHARWLFHKGGINGVYVAGVQLPQGATITSFKACFYDEASNKTGQAYLARTRLGVNEEMASVSSSGSGGYGFPVDTSVKYGQIDNSKYAYFVWWTLPASTTPSPPGSGDVVSCGMEIDYQYSIFIPMVIKNQ